MRPQKINMDGIQKSAFFAAPKIAVKKRRIQKVFFNDITRPNPRVKKVVQIIVPQAPFRPPVVATFVSQNIRELRQIYPKLPIFLTGLVLVLGFGLGIWFNQHTTTSSAEDIVPPKAAPNSVLLSLGPVSSVPNEVLFNMPIQQLGAYLKSLDHSPQEETAKALSVRKEKIKAFLEEKKSPLAVAAGTIAEQSNWRLILAIAFAESSLGKNCADNNCSNIGVAPGNAIWHKYASLNDWVIDFNRLLNKRYKDWTLEEMNGVYVQPKSPTWLLATKQILLELEQKGIN